LLPARRPDVKPHCRSLSLPEKWGQPEGMTAKDAIRGVGLRG